MWSVRYTITTTNTTAKTLAVDSTRTTGIVTATMILTVAMKEVKELNV